MQSQFQSLLLQISYHLFQKVSIFLFSLPPRSNMSYPISLVIPIASRQVHMQVIFFPKQILQVDITYGSAVAIYQYYVQVAYCMGEQEGLHQNLLSLQLCKLTVGSSQSPTIFIVNGKAAAAHSGTPIVHVQTINGHSICPTQTDFLSLNFPAIYV